jgi:hypothetical protein
VIDPHWTVTDLDPRTWRAIGRFFDPGQYIRAAQPGEHGLFVLHDNGTLLKVFDTLLGVRRDLSLRRVDDPRELAQQLFTQGVWDRVHVINKRHLAEVAYQAQITPQRSLHLDEYYQRVYHLLWGGSDGYVSVPAHPGRWHGWTFGNIQHFMSQLPPVATLALGVFDGSTPDIGLILKVQKGVITYVTTFEALRLSTELEVSQEGLGQLQSALAQQFAPAAGILLCTPDVFDRWIESEDKMGVLQEAREKGEASWLVDI